MNNMNVANRQPIGPYSGQTIHWPQNSISHSPESITVATYNIRRGKGKDGVRNLRRTAEVLKPVHLAALNEVGGPALWFDEDQAAKLGKLLHRGWLFAPNQKRWFSNHFGNGLISQVEIKSWQSIPLDYQKGRCLSPRNLLIAHTTLSHCDIPILITHIDRGEIRHNQLHFIFDQFQQHDRAILMGDLNTTADDPAMIELFGNPANIDAIKTALGPANSPKRINWIIVRGLQVINGGITPPGVSDHPFFWVELKPVTGL